MLTYQDIFYDSMHHNGEFTFEKRETLLSAVTILIMFISRIFFIIFKVIAYFTVDKRT